jgi:HK97 family phage major capsid protein
MTLQELRDKKGTLAAEADGILKAAAEAGRLDLRSEDEAKFDAIHADIEKVNATITRLERQEATMASLTETQGRRSEPNQPAARNESRIIRPGKVEQFEAMRSWLLAGSDVERTPEMREAAARAGVNLDQKQYRLTLPATALNSLRADDIREWENRTAQGVGSGGIGLYTVADEMMRELEVSMLAFGGMRQVATVLRTNTGADLPIPTVNDTAQKGAILGENSTASEQGVTFAQTVLQAFKYSSKYILVSVELLQDSSVNVAQFIGKALGDRIGRITNEHFTTGDGSSKPRGIVAAAGTGVTTATAQHLSLIYDNLVDLEHSVDPAYRGNAKFMFADSTLKGLKKIKIPQFSGDTNGMPLWQPGLVQGQPDRILGYPYVINQDMAAFAAAAKTVVFGDLSKYLIRDVRDVTLLRLDERFAEYHQVAFLAFSRHDGDLLDAGTDPASLIVMGPAS